MVKHRKIMAALGSRDTDLKGVYYALAAAGRMQADVFILKVNEPAEVMADSREDWKEQAMLDLVVSARQSGLKVSYHVARGLFDEEVIKMIREEGIDLVVLGENDRHSKQSLLQSRPSFSGQIIQVRGKNHIDYL